MQNVNKTKQCIIVHNYTSNVTKLSGTICTSGKSELIFYVIIIICNVNLTNH